MSANSHAAGSTVDMLVSEGSTPAVRGPGRATISESQPSRRILALEMFAAVAAVLVVSLGSFQFHFTLPVVGFVLFLIIVVTALRLGFWQATVTSLAAVGCLDFFFTTPLYSLKTDAAGLTALA